MPLYGNQEQQDSVISSFVWLACSNWLSILDMIKLPCSIPNESFVLISIGDVESV